VIVGTSDPGLELPILLKAAGRGSLVGTIKQLPAEVRTSDPWLELPTHIESVRKLSAQVCDFISLLDS
jgi:hypothetical protein